MINRFSRNAIVRVVPFAVFMVLLGVRGIAPPHSEWGFDARWLYGVTVLLVGGLLLGWWRHYGELSRQNLPDRREMLTAVAVGALVFGLWISLDAPWMQIGQPAAAFRPLDAQGHIDWPLVAVRWIGAALMVPVMEELFWRSFLMRWIAAPQFETVDPRGVGFKPIVLSTFVFMLAHTLWVAAIIAGLAYAWLYVRSGKLWMPVIAHAVTNGALGAWVATTGNWQFW
ncbi:MAG TPA: CAAX prenyl protease-related protein [Burkholderiaceae bacterium]|nr:CAAX prenyl protease-related protein [Burkholderiaceae bacterium]